MAVGTASPVTSTVVPANGAVSRRTRSIGSAVNPRVELNVISRSSLVLMAAVNMPLLNAPSGKSKISGDAVRIVNGPVAVMFVESRVVVEGSKVKVPVSVTVPAGMVAVTPDRS